jgi:glycosyltransferase involved in cell wall biosynthesis
MKIAVVSTSDLTGGAARAAHRIHDGFCLIGEESWILSANKTSNDKFSINFKDSISVIQSVNHSQEISFSDIQGYINHSRTDISNTLFSFPYPAYDISNHPIIKNTDIVNLHWVAFFQSPVTITKILDTGKPIVWTIHDEWAFTGGCHYSAGCNNFKDSCSECPQLEMHDSYIPKSILGDKLSLFMDRITVVGPSKWLAGQARKSRIFRNSRVENIPYSLDTETFIPYSKIESKRFWRIPENTFTFLFGAESMSEKRKGFSKLLEAILHLEKNEVWKDAKQNGKIHFLFVGPPSEELKNLGIPFTIVGTINNDTLLAKVYSAADIFVLPSLEDNMPYTMMESLSCGTPVVAFRIGGMPDIIKDGETGYIAEFADTVSLSEKILQAYTNPTERIRLGINARKDMEENYNLKIQAINYQKLFTDLLNKKLSKPLKKLESVDSTLGPITEQNFSHIQTEVSKWGLKNISKIISYNNQALELKKLRLQLNDQLSLSYLYTSNQGEISNEVQVVNEPCSEQKMKFSVFYDLSSKKESITEFIWIPMWKSGLEIQIYSSEVFTDEGVYSISPIAGNYQIGDLTKGHFLFYNSHGTIVFTNSSGKCLKFKITGEWKVINTKESSDSYKILFDEKLNSIYKSRTYHIAKNLSSIYHFFSKIKNLFKRKLISK